MRKFPAWATSLATLFVLCLLMHAEAPTATPAHRLAGTWNLVRAGVAQSDGTISVDPNYGPQARGVLMIDDEGRYSLQIFRPDRPKFATGDKGRGTPEEYQAAVKGLSTHAGRISIDAANHKLIFQIELSAFPNWEHTDQVRDFELNGDELSYRIPPQASGISAISVWRRVAAARALPSHMGLE